MAGRLGIAPCAVEALEHGEDGQRFGRDRLDRTRRDATTPSHH